MDVTHALAAGMGGMRTAGDLVARMQMARGMRLPEAKRYVADRLGCTVRDLSDSYAMEQIRGEKGLGRILDHSNLHPGEPNAMTRQVPHRRAARRADQLGGALSGAGGAVAGADVTAGDGREERLSLHGRLPIGVAETPEANEMKRITSVVLVALLALAAAATFAGCGLQDQAVENTTGKIDVAKDATVKAQLMMIKTGIQAYIATGNAAPPDASQATLGTFVSPWPTNPFSNQPMKPGDGVGDYVYTPGAGTAYTLSVHLSDGSTYTAP